MGKTTNSIVKIDNDDSDESESGGDPDQFAEMLFSQGPYRGFSLGITPDHEDFPKIDPYGIHKDQDDDMEGAKRAIRLSK